MLPLGVDEDEIFKEEEELLQNHPAFRERKFTKLLENMYGKDALAAQGKMVKAKVALKMKKQKLKRTKRACRAAVAKEPLQPEYAAKARMLIHEGSTRQELAGRVALVANSKNQMKRKSLEYKQKKNAKKGKFADSCMKAAKTKEQKKAIEEWMKTQPEYAQKPLEGTYVRVMQDPGHI